MTNKKQKHFEKVVEYDNEHIRENINIINYCFLLIFTYAWIIFMQDSFFEGHRLGLGILMIIFYITFRLIVHFFDESRKVYYREVKQ